jgi:hypothetical protein
MDNSGSSAAPVFHEWPHVRSVAVVFWFVHPTTWSVDPIIFVACATVVLRRVVATLQARAVLVGKRNQILDLAVIEQWHL